MRYDMRMDGRRGQPRNARGEFTRRGRGRRLDRGMDYGYPEYEKYGADGHYPMRGGKTGNYEPVEFMGYCTGYAGGKQDYGMDYRNYDMTRRDYGYPMHHPALPRYDYGDYADYGDYGETLSDKELEHWAEKLKRELDEQEKQMFHRDNVSQKAQQMGLQMHGFGEKELYVTTLMMYTDFKDVIGRNPDMAIRLAYDWLKDDDVAVKGAEKLAIYYDEIVLGDDYD